MTNLAVFNFESHEVRFVGTADDPWWIATDICAVLELGVDTHKHVQKLKENEKTRKTFPGVDNPDGIWCVNEKGLYRLIFRSNKPKAEAFQDWVFGEVLPNIRKTGSYSLQPQQQPQLPNGIKTEITTITNQRNEIKEQIKKHEEAIKQLKDTYRELDGKLLELANQFIDQHSEVVEIYRLCKKEVNQMIGNPYDARYDKYKES